MRRKATTAAMVLLILGGLAAVVVGIVLWREDPSKTEVAPAPPREVFMSTDGVEDNIERRLLRSSGMTVEARCPRRVSEKIGTTFRCSIRSPGTTERIAVASVRIRGEGGQFSWTSKALSTA